MATLVLVGVVPGTRKTHIATHCVCFFLHEHEAIATPSPIPGEVALRGESCCSHQKALPGLHRIEFISVFCFKLLGGAVAYLSSQVRASHHKLARHMALAFVVRLAAAVAGTCCANIVAGGQA